MENFNKIENSFPSRAMVPNSPKVTVIIPVLNSENTIKDCLYALTNQTYPSDQYEIIVVDNGSNDKSVEIIKQFPVKLLFEQKRPNSYLARNCGIKEAKGNYIAFIDSDCISEKEWLSALVHPFQKERVGIVAGEVHSYKPRNMIQSFYSYSDFLLQAKKVQGKIAAIGAGNTAFRREIFDIIGLFDESFRWGGDNDFGIRAQMETNFQFQFTNKARVCHVHRSSLRSLLKHAFTYGLGKGRLAAKYSNNELKKEIYKAFLTLFRLLGGIIVLPYHSYIILKSGYSISKSIAFPILDKLFCIIDQFGKIIFLTMKKDVFFIAK